MKVNEHLEWACVLLATFYVGDTCTICMSYLLLLLLLLLQWVGSPCGLHGPYIFYKAFQFHLEDQTRILSLGDFFLVRCKPEEPICIAELQLLWEERISRQLLSSSKLYFLPEDTPLGRNSDHGEVITLISVLCDPFSPPLPALFFPPPPLFDLGSCSTKALLI